MTRFPEREAYFRARIALMDDRNALQTAQAKGEAIGRAEGEKRTVQILGKLGHSAEEIVGHTGISLETVREILGDVPAGSSGGCVSGAG